MDRNLTVKSKIISLIKGCFFFICFYAATPYSMNPKFALETYPYSDMRYLYFTYLSLYFTLFTFVVSFIYRTRKILRGLLNVLIPLTFTLELIVTSFFWILYSIDPVLIVNKKTRELGYETPILTELGLHLFPFLLITLDQLDISIYKSRWQTPSLALFCTLWCIAISIARKYQNNKFLYKFMSYVTNDYLRYSLFALFIALVCGIQKIYILVKSRKNK